MTVSPGCVVDLSATLSSDSDGVLRTRVSTEALWGCASLVWILTEFFRLSPTETPAVSSLTSNVSD